MKHFVDPSPMKNLGPAPEHKCFTHTVDQHHGELINISVKNLNLVGMRHRPRKHVVQHMSALDTYERPRLCRA